MTEPEADDVRALTEKLAGGMAYEGALKDLEALLKAANVLADAYYARSEHLTDVIAERGKYYHELEHYRRMGFVKHRYPPPE